MKPLAILLVLFSLPAAARSEVRISWSVALSSETASCLAREAPGFAPFQSADFFAPLLAEYSYSSNQSPSAVMGDWDGDGALDAVLYGRQATRNRLLAVFATGDSCRIVDIRSEEAPEPSRLSNDFGPLSGPGSLESLSLARPGKKRSRHERKPLDLKTDAFILSYFGKSAVLRYFVGGKFDSFQITD